MGYLTSLSGGFTIDPPLNYSELTRVNANDFWGGTDYGPFRIPVDNQEFDTEDGVHITKRGLEIEVYDGDACKAYSIEKDLQKLVDAIPGHELHGEVIGDGEDNGDYWRLYVKDGKVVKEKAKLVWPDGTDVVL